MIARVLCATAQSEQAARAEQPPSARDAYEGAGVAPGPAQLAGTVIDRASGVVARSEWFEDEADARRHDELSADADALDAAAFRSRYRLP